MKNGQRTDIKWDYRFQRGPEIAMGIEISFNSIPSLAKPMEAHLMEATMTKSERLAAQENQKHFQTSNNDHRTKFTLYTNETVHTLK